MRTTIATALTAVSLVAASAAVAHQTVQDPPATAMPCASGAQGAMGQDMMDRGSMQRDMSAMMAEMSAMMNSTSDPSMKARMQKMHDQMAKMLGHMQKMSGGMGGTMMQGQQNSGCTPSVAPSAAPDDDAARHPN